MGGSIRGEQAKKSINCHIDVKSFSIEGSPEIIMKAEPAQRAMGLGCKTYGPLHLSYKWQIEIENGNENR